MRFSTRRRLRRATALLTLLAAAVLTQAATAAAPQSNSAPTISGQPREGRTLTANNGSWASSPASFAYQWQQCDSSGANCNPISGATSKTYRVGSGDADHTLKVAEGVPVTRVAAQLGHSPRASLWTRTATFCSPIRRSWCGPGVVWSHAGTVNILQNIALAVCES